VANTSSGYCTLHLGSYEPSGATQKPCQDGPVGAYLSTCRWKTQNVDVHNNLFSIDRDEVGHGCDDADDHCGRNALFSQWGVFPAYPAEAVQRAILFGQGNEFHRNIYQGTWRFTAFDQAPTSVRSIQVWSSMAPEDAATTYELWASPVQGMGQDDGSVTRRLPPPPPPPTTTTTTTTVEPSTTTLADPTTTLGPTTTSGTVGPPPVEPPPPTTVPGDQPTTTAPAPPTGTTVSPPTTVAEPTTTTATPPIPTTPTTVAPTTVAPPTTVAATTTTTPVTMF
jgi:hypothetical protein